MIVNHLVTLLLICTFCQRVEKQDSESFVVQIELPNGSGIFGIIQKKDGIALGNGVKIKCPDNGFIHARNKKILNDRWITFQFKQTSTVLRYLFEEDPKYKTAIGIRDIGYFPCEPLGDESDISVQLWHIGSYDQFNECKELKRKGKLKPGFSDKPK